MELYTTTLWKQCKCISSYPPKPPSAEVKERVELYLYSMSRASYACYRVNLTPYILQYWRFCFQTDRLHFLRNNDALLHQPPVCYKHTELLLPAHSNRRQNLRTCLHPTSRPSISQASLLPAEHPHGVGLRQGENYVDLNVCISTQKDSNGAIR